MIILPIQSINLIQFYSIQNNQMYCFESFWTTHSPWIFIWLDFHIQNRCFHPAGKVFSLQRSDFILIIEGLIEFKWLIHNSTKKKQKTNARCTIWVQSKALCFLVDVRGYRRGFRQIHWAPVLPPDPREADQYRSVWHHNPSSKLPWREQSSGSW